MGYEELNQKQGKTIVAKSETTWSSKDIKDLSQGEKDGKGNEV